LKARYYSVCRKIIRNRPWTGDESAKNSLLHSYEFDKGILIHSHTPLLSLTPFSEREKTRKMYVASLFARTPEQIAEEEGLYIEIKRLEQTERRFAKEREELMKSVAGIESGLNVHQPDEEAFSGLFIDPRKKKSDGTGAESPTSAGPSSGPARKVISAKQAAEGVHILSRRDKKADSLYDIDVLHCITRGETVSSTAPSTKTAHAPAHLRSTKLPTPKASIAPKVTALLGELGISPMRLVMPTKDNIQYLEGLLDAAAALIDTKKSVDRINQEIRTQQKLLGLSGDGDSQVDTTGEGGEDEPGEKTEDAQAEEEGIADAMDVDREQSVAVLDFPNEGVSRRQVRASIFLYSISYRAESNECYCQAAESQAIAIDIFRGNFGDGCHAC
jgi:DNA methyltransferase 1-associated protein 1